MEYRYNGEEHYLLSIAGLKRKLPIVEIEKKKLWIASFVMLGDTELNYHCAKELIKRLPHNSFGYIIAPEAKAIPLAQTICYLLREGRWLKEEGPEEDEFKEEKPKEERFGDMFKEEKPKEDKSKEEMFMDYIVLRKGVKPYMKSHYSVGVKSITTAEKQRLVIDGRDSDRIRGRNVCLIDDVVSTGESFLAMAELVKKAGAKIVFAGTVLKEGNFGIDNVERQLGVKLTYLGHLPVFVQ